MLEALNAQYSIMNFAPDLATAVLYQILDLVQNDRLEISIVLFSFSRSIHLFPSLCRNRIFNSKGNYLILKEII